MDAATQSWLDDLRKSGSLSDEDMNAIIKVASNPKVDEFIKGSSLRQADYSRKMQEVTSLKDQLTAKESEVTKYQGDLANWQTGAKEAYAKAVKEREDIAKQLSATQERFKSVVALHGIDDTELGTIVVPKKEEPVEKNYITKEELQEQMRSVATESALLDAAMHDLNVKHIELFGKPLSNGMGFVQEALASKKTLTAYFDEKFEVVKRTAALNEEAVTKRIADAVAANESKLRSELQISSPRAGDRPSPLFDSNFHPKQDGEGRKISAVEAATAAYNSGTYQAKQPGA